MERWATDSQDTRFSQYGLGMSLYLMPGCTGCTGCKVIICVVTYYRHISLVSGDMSNKSRHVRSFVTRLIVTEICQVTQFETKDIRKVLYHGCKIFINLYWLPDQIINTGTKSWRYKLEIWATDDFHVVGIHEEKFFSNYLKEFRAIASHSINLIKILQFEIKLQFLKFNSSFNYENDKT